MKKSRNRKRRARRTRKKGGTTPEESTDYLEEWSTKYNIKKDVLASILKSNYKLFKSLLNDPNPPLDMKQLQQDFVYSTYLDILSYLKTAVADYDPLLPANAETNLQFIVSLLSRCLTTATINNTQKYKLFIIRLNRVPVPSESNIPELHEVATIMRDGSYQQALIPIKSPETTLEIPKKMDNVVSSYRRTQNAKDCSLMATSRSITRTFTLLGLTSKDTVDMIFDAIYCIMVTHGYGDCNTGQYPSVPMIMVLDFLTKDADNGFIQLFSLNYNMIPLICSFKGVCNTGSILNFTEPYKANFITRLQTVIRSNVMELKTVRQPLNATHNTCIKIIHNALVHRYQPTINTYNHAVVLRKWNNDEVECIDSNQSGNFGDSHIIKLKDIVELCNYNIYTCNKYSDNTYFIVIEWIDITRFDSIMNNIRDSIYLPTNIVTPPEDGFAPTTIKVFPIPDNLKLGGDSKYVNIRLQYKHITICGFSYYAPEHSKIPTIIYIIGYLTHKRGKYFGIISYDLYGYIQNIDKIRSINNLSVDSPETIDSMPMIEPENFNKIIEYLSKKSDTGKFAFIENIKSLYQLE